MKLEVISRGDDLLIRRMVLEPGDATPWHTDSCRRFSVVVRGTALTIEFRDGLQEAIPVHAGLSEWNEPEPKVHRAINTGADTFEEVVMFQIDRVDQDPQPQSVARE